MENIRQKHLVENMKSIKITLLLIFSAVSVSAISAYAEAAVETSPADGNPYILCKNQKTVRTIRVDKDSADNKCVAVYTKSGVDREVGRAQNTQSCSEIVKNIKINLEKASWKCKEIGKVSIISTAEK
jgi:hypothetical protein